MVLFSLFLSLKSASGSSKLCTVIIEGLSANTTKLNIDIRTHRIIIILEKYIFEEILANGVSCKDKVVNGILLLK